MLLINTAVRYFPQFNLSVLSESEIFAFMGQEEILYLEDVRVNTGRFFRYKGHNFILVNPRLPDGFRLWVLAHEIAHYICGHPAKTFDVNTDRKSEYEANIIASVLLIPQYILLKYSFEEIIDLFGYPPELVVIRGRLYFANGI